MIIELLILATIITVILWQEQRIKAITDYIASLDEKLINETSELREKIERNTNHFIETSGEVGKINEWKDRFHRSVYSALNHYEEEIHEALNGINQDITGIPGRASK